MTPEILADWLGARLTGPRGQEDALKLLQAGWAEIKDQPSRGQLPAPAIEAGLLDLLSEGGAPEAARALTLLSLDLAAELGGSCEAPVGRWLSAAARQQLLEILDREGLIDPAWIRAVFEQELSEELFTETLHRTLIDFSKVVPRIVSQMTQSVLPTGLGGGLGRLARLGQAAAAGVGDRLKDEVDERLLSEVRRYLDKGSKKALEGAANFAVRRVDDPAAKRSRRKLAVFALGQSEAFHVRPLTPALREELAKLAELSAAGLAENKELKARLRAVAEALDARFGDLSLAELLSQYGLPEPPLQAFLDASWPLVRRAVSTAEGRALLSELAGEIHALYEP